jgi:hypothetical protein
VHKSQPRISRIALKFWFCSILFHGPPKFRVHIVVWNRKVLSKYQARLCFFFLACKTAISFRWDIFNYGRIKNNVRVQDARFEQLLVTILSIPGWLNCPTGQTTRFFGELKQHSDKPSNWFGDSGGLDDYSTASQRNRKRRERESRGYSDR